MAIGVLPLETSVLPSKSRRAANMECSINCGIGWPPLSRRDLVFSRKTVRLFGRAMSNSRPHRGVFAHVGYREPAPCRRSVRQVNAAPFQYLSRLAGSRGIASRNVRTPPSGPISSPSQLCFTRSSASRRIAGLTLASYSRVTSIEIGAFALTAVRRRPQRPVAKYRQIRRFRDCHRRSVRLPADECRDERRRGVLLEAGAAAEERGLRLAGRPRRGDRGLHRAPQRQGRAAVPLEPRPGGSRGVLEAGPQEAPVNGIK